MLIVAVFVAAHLIPAFFIAGAIANFVSQCSVIKYLGSEASRIVAYSVASVSGVFLAVCSCTVLSLFSGIYRLGACLGPAVNVLAIVITARAVGAVIFAVAIGLLMPLLFAGVLVAGLLMARWLSGQCWAHNKHWYLYQLS